MNAFSDELRKERETRGITLADIAKKTRINIKYLEALEQGAFDMLPQTYIRAFIRSYAEAVGISADQALHHYDIIVTQKYSDTQSVEEHSIPSPLHPTKEKETEIRKEKRMRVIFVAAGVVTAVFLIGIYLFDMMAGSLSPEPVKETSFQEVVHEQERSVAAPPAADSIDSTRTMKAPEPDSLILRAVAVDSVWITIKRDSLPPRSGYMLRGRYRTYIARKEFRVSLSDAASIRLFLNGKELEPLGKKGERVQNKKITAEFLTL